MKKINYEHFRSYKVYYGQKYLYRQVKFLHRKMQLYYINKEMESSPASFLWLKEKW
jgi:hypothetical protein